jgi:hypothetical protein
MRKRLLRYDGSTTTDDGEVWQMTLTRDQTTHRVVHPPLTDAEIAGVSEQLSAILHGDMGVWATVTDESDPQTEPRPDPDHETSDDQP